MPARKLAPGALQRVVLEHFKGKTCFWAPSKTIAFLFNVYCYFCDFGADLGREHFWALLGSGFEVSGVSGVRVRGFGRSWDKRKNLVAERAVTMVACLGRKSRNDGRLLRQKEP